MDIEKPYMVNKYDRQIRLWGTHGQKRLMDAKICLLSCEPAGVETLKNLILPGIGYFTIIDDKKVTDKDLGNNFFVNASQLGQERSHSVCRNLIEMNSEDVKGDSLNLNPQLLIRSQPEFFKQFTLVISNELNKQDNLLLSDICSINNIQLIILYTSGLIAYLKVFSPEHCISETKPFQVNTEDYRLLRPWPELQDIVNSTPFFEIKKQVLPLPHTDDYIESSEFQILLDKHLHIPWILIGIKQIQDWMIKHQNKPPQTFAEKDQFKSSFNQLFLSNHKNCPLEENIEQAKQFSYHCYKDPANLPNNIQQLFSKVSTMTLIKNKTNIFWYFAKALQQFYQNFQCLPLLGDISDMFSSPELFIQLKNCFKAKAEKDFQIMKGYVENLIGEKLQDAYLQELKIFCKFNTTIDSIIYRTFRQELACPQDNIFYLMDDNYSFKFYFAIRAVMEFEVKYNRHPQQSIQNDKIEIQQIINKIKSNFSQCQEEIGEQICEEMCRYEGSHLHNIAALIGGIASQEIVKLISKQFMPLNNTLIYNGIDCQISVFEL